MTKQQKREKFNNLVCDFGFGVIDDKEFVENLEKLFFPEKPDKVIIEDCLRYSLHRVIKHPNAGLHASTTAEEIKRVLKKYEIK